METQEETEVQGEVPAVENVPQETIDPEIIQRARMMGHIPKDQFKGDPSKWVPEDVYVERADTLMPIMKHTMKKYEGDIASLRATVESQKKTTEKMLKMNETVQQRAYEQAKRELTKEQAQAVADGDVEKWQKLEDQKEGLPKPEPIVVEEPVSPVFNQWKMGNEWYLKDEDMTEYANFYGQNLQSKNPSMPYEDLLIKVEEKIKQIFPQRFENPERSKPSVVDGSATREIEKKSGNTYNDLPADAKEMCNLNVKQGLFKSKEEWVKSYFEED